MGRTKKSQAEKHIHRVIRVSDIWKCAFPDCKYFMYQRQATKVLLGREILCWSCGEKFPMDEEAFQFDQPICLPCRAPEVNQLIEVAEGPKSEVTQYLDAMKNNEVNRFSKH